MNATNDSGARSGRVVAVEVEVDDRHQTVE